MNKELLLKKAAEYRRFVTDGLYNGDRKKSCTPNDTIDYIKFVYSLAGLEEPVVIIADSISDYRRYYELLNTDTYQNVINKLVKSYRGGTKQTYDNTMTMLQNMCLEISDSEAEKVVEQMRVSKSRSDFIYLLSMYSRVYINWYWFIHKEANISFDRSDDLSKLNSMVHKTLVSRTKCWDSVCLTLTIPNNLEFSQDDSLHCTTGPSYSFNGENYYYINGRETTSDIVNLNFTKEDFISEENEDVKASMITVLKERRGTQGVLDFLNAECVDTKTIAHSDGSLETVELYKTHDRFDFVNDRHGNTNQQMCWSKMTCPSTGSVYLIENSSDFTDAIEAMKFLRPSVIPMDVEYNWNLFSN